MARINPYDKHREQIAAWNAANPKFRIIHDRYTRDNQLAARPFILNSRYKSGLVAYVARYATLEAAMKGAEKRADW